MLCDTLGFEVLSEDPFATVFDLNGTQLRISEVSGHQPPPHTVLGWEVPDIEASVKALKAKDTNRVAWFLDPDGNNLSLTQF